MPTPSITQALGDAYTGRPVSGPNPGFYREDFMDAPYLPYEIQNEILGAVGASVAHPEYHNLWICGTGDQVGSAVRISDNNTLTTGLDITTGDIDCIGFIRSKPTTTTCYIMHHYLCTVLAGGVAGGTVYLQDDGSFGPTPGTVPYQIGQFTSATTGILFIAPKSIPVVGDVQIGVGHSLQALGELNLDAVDDIHLKPGNVEKATLLQNGNFGIGETTPTASLHIQAGTPSAGTAPIKLTSGPLLATEEEGAIEFLDQQLFITINEGTGTEVRKEVTLNDEALTSGQLPAISADGRLVNSGIIASSILAGTYTAVFSNIANLDATPTPTNCQYMRVGDVVTVSGMVSLDPTATGLAQVGITLPIASNFASVEQCAGTGSSTNNNQGFISAEATLNIAVLEFTSIDTGSQLFFFHFTYSVVA